MSNEFPASAWQVSWGKAALQGMQSPASPVACPECACQTVSVAWHIVDFRSRTAQVDLQCSSCKTARSLQVPLPQGVAAFFPFERLGVLQTAVKGEIDSMMERVQRHTKTMPAAAFTTDPLWAEARWSATTYQWHPNSEAPPVMGIVFDDAEAGKELFRKYAKSINHTDRFEELRVSIIEGSRPGEQYGYSVHLCPDPDSLAAHATMDDMVVDQNVVHFLGQWTRAYPIPGSKPLLPKFRTEFNKHKEFLLAPAIRRPDGQLWMEPTLGIIKNTICFRQLSEITRPDDPDAGALIMPELIKPAPSKDGGEGCFGG